MIYDESQEMTPAERFWNLQKASLNPKRGYTRIMTEIWPTQEGKHSLLFL